MRKEKRMRWGRKGKGGRENEKKKEKKEEKEEEEEKMEKAVQKSVPPSPDASPITKLGNNITPIEGRLGKNTTPTGRRSIGTETEFPGESPAKTTKP